MSQGAAESPRSDFCISTTIPVSGRLVERTLSRHGFHVSHALSGDEGLSRLADGQFEIVALDHFMPGKEGLEVLAEIQDSHRPAARHLRHRAPMKGGSPSPLSRREPPIT